MQPAFLSGSEVQRLLDALERRDRAIVMLRYGSGLRIEEALTTADVDAGRGALTIRHTKGRHDRIVPLPAVTLEALRSWMRLRGSVRNTPWLRTQQPKLLRAVAEPVVDGGTTAVTLRSGMAMERPTFADGSSINGRTSVITA